jgi:hypothetical protein
MDRRPGARKCARAQWRARNASVAAGGAFVGRAWAP